VARQIVLNRWPVGTGPYYLHTFMPNQKIVLERNKNFRGETYPTEGEESDAEAGFLNDAGKPVPFVDRRVSNIEREAIPRWNKFLQGYYDEAGVLREPKAQLSSDVFDQAVSVSTEGDLDLSPRMLAHGIEKVIAYDTAIYNFAFNMQDKVVGGYSEEKCKLRQAISIALPYGEYIDIFKNGRGLSAQSPIPPGIFGYETGEAARSASCSRSARPN
jgi:oligopeptide transport system substrate-binding protein